MIEGRRITEGRRAILEKQKPLEMSTDLLLVILLQALLLYRSYDRAAITRQARQLAYRAGKLFRPMPPRAGKDWLNAIRIAAACCAACMEDGDLNTGDTCPDAACLDLLHAIANGNAADVFENWAFISANARRVFTDLTVDIPRAMK